jgi:hypothetical protein
MIYKLLTALIALCTLHPALACTSADSQVRILVAFTPQAQQYESNFPGLSNSHIAALNAAFSQSGVGLTAASVGYYLFDQDFLRPGAKEAVTDASQSVGVLAAREALCADVVAIYHATSDGSAVAAIGSSNASEAMFVIDVVSYDNRTFQHEFGHLLGARHQRTGGLYPLSDDPDPGNAHGHYIRERGNVLVYPIGRPARYRQFCALDIMAYTPQPSLGGVTCDDPVDIVEDSATIFSSPALLWCTTAGTGSQGGIPPNGCAPWGTAQADNVTKMNSLVPQIKTFRNINLWSQKIEQISSLAASTTIIPSVLE